MQVFPGENIFVEGGVCKKCGGLSIRKSILPPLHALESQMEYPQTVVTWSLFFIFCHYSYYSQNK